MLVPIEAKEGRTSETRFLFRHRRFSRERRRPYGKERNAHDRFETIRVEDVECETSKSLFLLETFR